MITYSETKEFETEQIRELFDSVNWFSGKFPEKLQTALRNSTKVISAWDGGKLVGLIRGMDDGIWQATIDCLLVDPAYQGRGIASELTGRLLEEYHEFLYISVAPNEKKNVEFYRRKGFAVMEEATLLQIKGQAWRKE